MKERYVAPQLQLLIFQPKEQVATSSLDPLSDHDNSYVDWGTEED